jgi:hypothetical protein
VSFVLSDALGYYTNGAATLELAPASGPEAGVYRPATSATESGDRFANERHGHYGYRLATAGLSKGEWDLRVAVDDGTVHTTRIELR